MATSCKQGDLDSDTEPLSRTSSQSASSISKSNTSTSLPSIPFQPTKLLFVHAHGIPTVRVPGPSYDIRIRINSIPHNLHIRKALSLVRHHLPRFVHRRNLRKNHR